MKRISTWFTNPFNKDNQKDNKGNKEFDSQHKVKEKGIISNIKSRIKTHGNEDVFVLFKQLQSLYAKEELLKIKKETIETKIKDLNEEIQKSKDLLLKNLTESVLFNGKTVIDIISSLFKDNLISFNKKENMIYNYVYKYLRKYIVNNQMSSGYVLFYGEVTDDGHLIICPDKDNCEIHKNKSLIKVGLDLSQELMSNETNISSVNTSSIKVNNLDVENGNLIGNKTLNIMDFTIENKNNKDLSFENTNIENIKNENTSLDDLG